MEDVKKEPGLHVLKSPQWYSIILLVSIYLDVYVGVTALILTINLEALMC